MNRSADVAQKDDFLDQLAIVISGDESVGFPGPIVANHRVQHYGKDDSARQFFAEGDLIPPGDVSSRDWRILDLELRCQHVTCWLQIWCRHARIFELNQSQLVSQPKTPHRAHHRARKS